MAVVELTAPSLVLHVVRMLSLGVGPLIYPKDARVATTFHDHPVEYRDRNLLQLVLHRGKLLTAPGEYPSKSGPATVRT